MKDYIKEEFIYNGTPPQPQVIEPSATQIGAQQQFRVWGQGFQQILNVYLSGAPLSALATTCDPFSASVKLSADNPPFTGVKLLSTDWLYNRDNFLSFIMPSASGKGFVELIVENSVGYGKLTENVKVSDYNPYPPSYSQYSSFVPYQVPYLSGIQVF